MLAYYFGLLGCAAGRAARSGSCASCATRPRELIAEVERIAQARRRKLPAKAAERLAEQAVAVEARLVAGDADRLEKEHAALDELADQHLRKSAQAGPLATSLAASCKALADRAADPRGRSSSRTGSPRAR